MSFRKYFWIFSFAAILQFSAFSVLMAQEGSSTLPSISGSIGKVYLVNPTSSSIVFYLDSAGTSRTEHNLDAGASATFSGTSEDEWFNIEVYSGNSKVEYALDAGKRYVFRWKDSRLDVFNLPPR